MAVSNHTQSASQAMPDVASKHRAHTKAVLDWVGMSQIEMPVVVEGPHHRDVQVNAKVQAYVDLIDPEAKGIHMSRLYLGLDEILGDRRLNGQALRKLLSHFTESHAGLSRGAHVEFRFDYLVRRPALKSKYSGWKGYAVMIAATRTGEQFDVEMAVDVPYSSTCPCSAALARQLIQKQFENDFAGHTKVDVNKVIEWLGSEKGIVATPHSQRSHALVRVRLGAWQDEMPILALIDRIESVLKTAVQTAVKRADEQEFARLNGQNLMFCEDAARRIKAALDKVPDYLDFWLRVEHLESLHAHDAVAMATKGVKDGYVASATVRPL